MNLPFLKPSYSALLSPHLFLYALSLSFTAQLYSTSADVFGAWKDFDYINKKSSLFLPGDFYVFFYFWPLWGVFVSV